MKTLFWIMSMVFSFSLSNISQQEFDYKAAWEKVTELRNNGLPKSALEIVKNIYIAAKQENNYVQLTKAIKITTELWIETEEQGFENSVTYLEEQKNILPSPSKQIIASYLAEMYNQYFQSHRYEISQISNVSDSEQNNYKTWDSQKFYQKISNLYQFSISGDSLNLPADVIAELLSDQKNYDIFIRPTIYSLLWDRVHNYYKDAIGQVTLSLESQYIIKDPDFLGDFHKFTGINLSQTSIEDPVYIVLQGYQNMLNSLNQSNFRARADYDLSRLQFVFQNCVIPHKDSLYEATLRKMTETYASDEYVTMVYAALANQVLQSNRFTEAVEISKKGMSLYPESPGYFACKNVISQIEKKEATLTTEQVFLSSELPRFALDYKNINSVKFVIYQLDKKIGVNPYSEPRQSYENLKNGSVQVYSKIWQLPKGKKYENMKIEGVWPKLPKGSYVAEMTESDEKSGGGLLNYSVFHVSDLAYTSFHDKNVVTYRVVNRASGKPVKDAMITLYQMDYNDNQRTEISKKLQEKKTDEKGGVSFSYIENTRIRVVVQKNKDFLSLGNDSYFYKRYYQEQEYSYAEVFTDRSIYRPGQSVHFKAIAIKTTGSNRHEVVKDVPLEITLYDANYQKVSANTLTTNDFGSVAGSFVLPAGGLTGQYHMGIQSKKGISAQKYFRVEEYKRPSFEINIDSFTQAYRLNNEVKVSGDLLNYAGNPLDGAEVEYKVVRGVRYIDWGWWWRPGPSFDNSERVIVFGKTKSDRKGEFNFNFKAVPNENIPEKDDPIFDFKIEITVKDITGETHTAESVVSVGYKSLILKSDLEESLDVKNVKLFRIKATNLSGLPQKCTGKIIIEKLQEPDRLHRQKYWDDNNRSFFSQELIEKGIGLPKPPAVSYSEWKVDKEVYKGTFDSEIPVDGVTMQTAGVYKITATAKDIFGMETKGVSYHQVKDFEKKSFPKTKPLHVSLQDAVVEPGSKVNLYFGAAEKPVYLLLVAENNGTVLLKENIKVNKTLSFSYPVSESNRGGITFHVMYVYNNRHEHERFFVDVPFTNKQLDIKLETFRDKIYPGTKEEYSFVITGDKKDGILAEMATTMFDASLESFEKHNWRQQFYNSGYSQLYTEVFGFQGVQNFVLNYEWNSSVYEGNVYYLYPSLKGIDIYHFGRPVMYRNRRGQGEVILETKAGNAQDMMAESAPAAKTGDERPQNAKTEATKETETPVNSPAIRKNLAETVFFFPQLKTDAQGNVKISFTMNEALTKWKMMSFVHTPDLKVGYDERFVQTYKKLMVFPNTPRFLRTGDKLIVTAKLVNTTSTKLKTSASMKLTDAITGKDVTSLFVSGNVQKEVSIGGETSISLEWEVLVPQDFTNTLTWTVEAEAGGHKDGEENAIPVLTNKVLVTETLPLYVHGKQSKDFTFPSFVKNNSLTKLDNRFSIEYTSHPVWYVVQALPYLTEQGFECTEHIVNRYFANTLASKIAGANPRISKVFDQWRNADKDALSSKLMTNQELKSALVTETPWVMNALKEEEQKRNIALLFEVNQLKYELTQTLKKLQERQLANGAFPWFVSGRADLYVTQYIVETLGQLKKLDAIGDDNPVIDEIIRKAMDYIDSETLYWYNKNKEIMKNGVYPVHYLGYHYLYIRSFFTDFELPKENEEVYNYYFKKAKEEWLQQNLYTQVMIGIVMKRSDDKTADKIYASLEERSFKKDEMGKYWNAGNGYRWDELPIERQSRIIEFYNEMDAPTKEIELMKIWLLKNKQTRNWPTTKSTSSAIYAILLEGERSAGISWLEETSPVDISRDNKIIEFDKAQSGTGYVSKSWTNQTFPKSWGNIKVDNPNSSTSWGAMYYQYFEDMDKVVSASDNPLKIIKNIFLVKQSNKGEVLEEIKPGLRLMPGDKLTVRLRVISDRSMDYVHLKDWRGSGLEPVSTLSGYRYAGGLSFYENVKDLATHFYIDHLPKGDHIIEYSLRINHKGEYSGGLATLQSMYAPEFSSHSSGIKLEVK